MKQETKNRFAKLIREHEGIIYKISFMYADDPMDREDLYQEIAFQAWKGFHHYRGEAAFSTWLYQVALNTAITSLKRQKRSKALFTSVDVVPDTREPEPNEWKDERLSMLKQAINALNEIEKAVVVLFLEGRSYEEMEVITGITSGTLRVKMNRIKEKLRINTKQKTYGNG